MATEIKELLENAKSQKWVIILTPDYIYCQTSADGSIWKEIVYMTAEKTIELQNLPAEKAIQLLNEEARVVIPQNFRESSEYKSVEDLIDNIKASEPSDANFKIIKDASEIDGIISSI